MRSSLFFFNDPAPTEIYTLSLHDALPILKPSALDLQYDLIGVATAAHCRGSPRSEEHTSELQSRFDLVCRLLLEKKKSLPYPTPKQSASLPHPTVPSCAVTDPSSPSAHSR